MQQQPVTIIDVKVTIIDVKVTITVTIIDVKVTIIDVKVTITVTIIDVKVTITVTIIDVKVTITVTIIDVKVTIIDVISANTCAVKSRPPPFLRRGQRLGLFLLLGLVRGGVQVSAFVANISVESIMHMIF